MGAMITSEASDALALAAQVLADPTGLNLPENLPFRDWEIIGRQLMNMERSVMWWIGDWLRFGERRYGEMYAQAVEATGYSAQTLMDAKWVAERYPISDRSENLSWSHHRAAASLPTLERADVLSSAKDNGWSRRELQDEIKRREGIPPLRPQVGADVAAVKALAVAGISHWLGIARAPADALVTLLWNGAPMTADELVRVTGAPKSSIHVQIHQLRQILEVEALDCESGGYFISDSGYEECHAMLSQIVENFQETIRRAEAARITMQRAAA